MWGSREAGPQASPSRHSFLQSVLGKLFSQRSFPHVSHWHLNPQLPPRAPGHIHVKYLHTQRAPKGELITNTRVSKFSLFSLLLSGTRDGGSLFRVGAHDLLGFKFERVGLSGVALVKQLPA